MGKATIISHQGAGLYSVAINYDACAYAQRVAALTASLADLDSQLISLSEQITLATEAQAYCLGILNAAIAAKDLPYIKSAEGELLNVNAKLAGLRQTQTTFKARRLAASKGLETLQATPPADRLVDAWCADLSEELSGVVGTIDPVGADSGTLLRPGYEGQASYEASRDGLYRMREHMGPAEAFYNAAMRPGWQKWLPTYRIGTITALNGNSCDLALDPVASDAQGLDVNQAATLSGVGVDYMDCHGAAFEVGDTVVVMFQGQAWENPQVIGFEANPKPCTLRGISYLDGLESALASGQQFNVLEYKAAVWAKKSPAAKAGLLAGNINWTNGTETLSWWGLSRYFSTITTTDTALRDVGDSAGLAYSAGMGTQIVKGQMYCLKQYNTDPVAENYTANVFLITSVAAQMGGPYFDEATARMVSGEDIYGGYGSYQQIDLGLIDNILYHQGQAHVLPAAMGDRINGAAFVDLAGARKLVVVCREDYDTSTLNRSLRNTRENVWIATLTSAGITDPVKIATFNYASQAFFNLSPWLFSADGKSAVCHRFTAAANNPKLCRIELNASLDTVTFHDDGFYCTDTTDTTYAETPFDGSVVVYTHTIEHTMAEIIRDYVGNTLTTATLTYSNAFEEIATLHILDSNNYLVGDIDREFDLLYKGGFLQITIDGVVKKNVVQSASALRKVDTFVYVDNGPNNFLLSNELSASGVTTRHLFLNDIDLRDGYINLETLTMIHGTDNYTAYGERVGFPALMPPTPEPHGYGGEINCTATHEAFNNDGVIFTESVNRTISAVPDITASHPFRNGLYGLRFATYSKLAPLTRQSGSVSPELGSLWPAFPWPDYGSYSATSNSPSKFSVGTGRLPHFARNWRQIDVQMASTSAFENGGQRLVASPKLANALAQIIRFGTEQTNWTQSGAARIAVLQSGDINDFFSGIISFPAKV